MDGPDLAVIWLNLLGSTAAVPINFIAARRGFLATAWLHYVIGAIAAIYAIGYAMLLAGTVSVADWSAFYRGVSVPVWFVVWSLPSLLSLLTWRKITTEVAEAAERHRSDADRGI